MCDSTNDSSSEDDHNMYGKSNFKGLRMSSGLFAETDIADNSSGPGYSQKEEKQTLSHSNITIQEYKNDITIDEKDIKQELALVLGREASQVIDGCQASSSSNTEQSTRQASSTSFVTGSQSLALTVFRKQKECRINTSVLKSYIDARVGLKRVSYSRRNFVCNVCFKVFDQTDKLETHKIVHYSNLDTKETIVNRNKGKIFSCKTCTFQSELKYQLMEHNTVHTGQHSFICKVCNATFATRQELIAHNLTHDKDKPEIRCNICNLKFTSKRELIQHTKTHRPIILECDICKYKTLQKIELEKHISCYHSISKLLECNICYYKTKSVESLKQHELVHKPKIFACKLCPYETPYLKYLTKHSVVHSKEKQYLCEVCAYQAKHLTALNDHMRTHTGEKPFKCDKCSFETSQNSHLTVHMVTHSKEFPYVCSRCPYKCNVLSNLKKHENAHKKKDLADGLTK